MEKYFYSALVPLKNAGRAQLWLTTLVRDPVKDEGVRLLVEDYLSTRDGAILYPLIFDLLKLKKSLEKVQGCISDKVEKEHDDYIFSLRELVIMLMHMQPDETTKMICTLLIQNSIPLPLLFKSSGVDNSQPGLCLTVKDVVTDLAIYPLVLALKVGDEPYGCSQIVQAAFHLSPKISYTTGSILHSPSIDAYCTTKEGCIEYQRLVVESNGWTEAPVFLETIAFFARLSMLVIVQYKAGDRSMGQLRRLIETLKTMRPGATFLLIHRDALKPDSEIESIISAFPKAEYYTVKNISNQPTFKKPRDKLIKFIEDHYDAAVAQNTIVRSSELPTSATPQKRWLTGFMAGLYSGERADSTKIHELSRKRAILKKLMDKEKNFHDYRRGHEEGEKAIDIVKLKRKEAELERNIANIRLGPETMGFLETFEHWGYFDIWQCGHALYYWFKKSQSELMAQLYRVEVRATNINEELKKLEKEENARPPEERKRQGSQTSRKNSLKNDQLAINKEIKGIEKERVKHAITIFTLLEEAMETACHDRLMKDPGISKLIKSFTSLYTNEMFLHGYPLQFIRGEQLVLESGFIEDVFTECQAKLKPRRLSVVTIIGRQSEGKSTLINAMFGASFLVNSDRCTIGLYCSLYHAGDGHYILVFDSEGLMSMRTRDEIFDKHITILAFLISDIVIYNKKAPIDDQELNLFQMAGLGAKILQLPGNKRDRPTIVFALRDQDPKALGARCGDVLNMKAKLEKALNGAGTTINDCIHIYADSVFLLTPPTEKSDGIEIPSEEFASRAMDLRSCLIKKLEAGAVVRTSLLEFYKEAVTLYSNVVQTGTQVLSFESIEKRRITESAKKIAIEIFDRSDFPKRAVELVNEFDVKAAGDPGKTKDLVTVYAAQMIAKRAETAGICVAKFDAVAKTNKIPDRIQTEIASYLKDQFYKAAAFYSKILEVYADQYLSKSRVNEICEALNKKINAVEDDNEEEIAKCRKEIDAQIEQMKKEIVVPPSMDRQCICKSIEDELQSALDRANYEDLETASIRKLTAVQIDSAAAIDISHWFCEKRGVTMDPAKRNKIYGNIMDEIEKKQKEFFGPLNDYKKLPQEMINLEGNIMKFVEAICKMERTDTYELNIKILRTDILQIYMNKLADYLEKKESDRRTDMISTSIRILDTAHQKLIVILMGKMREKTNETLAKIIHREIAESLTDSELKSIQLYVKDEIRKEFPTPEAIIRYAFKISFEEHEEEKVYKYIRNPNMFIKEIFASILNKHLNALVGKPQERLRSAFKEKINLVIAKLSNKITTSLAFQKALKEDDSLSVYTFIFPDSVISDIPGLKLRLQNIGAVKILMDPEEEKRLRLEILKINGPIKAEIETLVTGCQATCPMCGAKCKLMVNHKDPDHKALHQLCAFAGWKNNWFSTPILDPCVTALQQVLYGETGEEVRIESMFKKRFPAWQRDLDSPEMIAPMTTLKRGWISAHLPLLCEFKMRRFVPPELEGEIKALERLPVHYSAPGYTTGEAQSLIIGDVLVDTVFLMDCTGSMGPQIEQCKKTIKDLITLLQNTNGAKMRAAFVGYRDHCDEDLILYKGFVNSNNIDDLINYIRRNVVADGGGDGPEAVADGLQYVLDKVPWNPSAVKFVYHIFDAPPHGDQYDCGWSDDYPQGCPCKRDPNKILQQMRKMSNLQFCMICCQRLDETVFQFKSVFPEISVMMLSDPKNLTAGISNVMFDCHSSQEATKQ